MTTDARSIHGASGTSRSGDPSLASSYNAQIEDLVQRLRTAEQVKKRLLEEKATNAERAKRDIQDVRGQWHSERTSWREGCNRLISCHHLAHLRLSAKLSEAESLLLKEMEVSRQEKVARLHRDFQITMFGVREAELDARIEELEDALQVAQRSQEFHSSELVEQIQALEEEIVSLQEERSSAEKELLEIREKHSRLQVKAESDATKVERLNLQFDGAQSTNADLQRQNDELKRAHADLKRQMDRWQNLETKGGEEVEALRKRNLDLEVSAKSLEDRLAKKESELQKEKKKVLKLKENVDEFEQYATDSKKETEEAMAELSKANKRIERLQRDLESERADRSSSPRKRKESPSLSEDEVANDFAEEPPVSSPPKPPPKKPMSKTNAQGRTKPATQAVAGPSRLPDPEIEEIPNPKPQTTKADAGASKRGKAKQASRTARGSDSESEFEVKVVKSREKGKGAAIEEIEDSESEKKSKTVARPRRKREGTTAGASRKPPSEATEVSERSKTQKSRKAVTSVGSVQPRGTAVISDDGSDDPAGVEADEVFDRAKARKSRKAPAARAASVQPRGTAMISDDGSDEPARKKMRKLGVFPSSSQPASFNFLPAGDAGGGLDIPTVLSPVKETDVVPSRSSANSRTGSALSMMGSIGGLFGGRRK